MAPDDGLLADASVVEAAGDAAGEAPEPAVTYDDAMGEARPEVSTASSCFLRIEVGLPLVVEEATEEADEGGGTRAAVAVVDNRGDSAVLLSGGGGGGGGDGDSVDRESSWPSTFLLLLPDEPAAEDLPADDVVP
jgi:hypothetical protein